MFRLGTRARQAGRSALLVEELLAPIGPEPLLEQAEVVEVVPDSGQWHLVRPERAFDLYAVDPIGAGPPLRCAQHDERPARPAAVPVTDSGLLLDAADARPA